MKVLLLILALNVTALVYAEEVKTDCPYINQDDERTTKDVKIESVRSQSGTAISG